MNKGKNQNSILVLATLGVYLGLVLVGATPQVWAQAATAKQFDIKDEIEATDKLDNDPDDCRVASIEKIRELKTAYLWFNDVSIKEYQDLLEQVLDSYSDVAAFDVSWKPTGDRKPWRAFISNTDLIGTEKSACKVDDGIIILANGLPGEAFSFTATNDASGHSFRVVSKEVSYDQPLVRYLYGTALDFYRCSKSGSILEEVIYRLTEIKVENRNLIITTRLPRGSLDSLLASNAK